MRFQRSRRLIDSGKPVFGICLGHQMLGLAIGAKTCKMHQGHHGANHPVKDFTTGKVEITSMNHGFAVDRDTLPAEAEETHRSLFRRLQLRFAVEGQAGCSRCNTTPKPRPAPRTAITLFQRFINLIREEKGLPSLEERRQITDRQVFFAVMFFARLAGMNELPRQTQESADHPGRRGGTPGSAGTLEEFERLTELGVFTEEDRIELIGGNLFPCRPKAIGMRFCATS